MSVTVAVTGFPPTTLDALSDSAAIATPDVAVSVGDVVLLPFSVAVIVAEPGATAVTTIDADDAPAATASDGTTVATAVLLLASAIVRPPVGAAADSVIVPWSVVPATALVALKVMDDTVGPVVGVVDEFELQALTAIPTSATAQLADRDPRCFTIMEEIPHSVLMAHCGSGKHRAISTDRSRRAKPRRMPESV